MRPELWRRLLPAWPVALLAAAAAVAPWLPGNPYRTDLGAVFTAPSAAHWMGTDGLGRDVASRLAHGARVSLTVGFATAAGAILVGLPLGAVAGYRGGFWDAAVSRVIEAALCFPALLVAVAILIDPPAWLRALPDPLRVAAALAALGWTPAARYLRAEFLRLRGSEAVLSARAAGAGTLRIVALHLLPRSLGPVLVSAAFGASAAALAEAALSFVGVGVSPPTPTWGAMLLEAMRQSGRAWWLALFPGLALFATVYGLNGLAEGIRDWLDPRPQHR
ncbi:MAG TPA: ABC transporter permease [Candidatus Sulfotelmatobacter sp.]|nr:ABC transporter permease [Candidatus Sulfotelmatobacter sp.]